MAVGEGTRTLDVMSDVLAQEAALLLCDSGRATSLGLSFLIGYLLIGHNKIPRLPN